MPVHRVIRVLFLTAGVVAIAHAYDTPKYRTTWCPEVEAIRKAGAVQGEVEQTLALREALEGALFSPREDARREAIEFLSLFRRQMNLAALADLLRSYDQRYAKSIGGVLVAWSEIDHLPGPERAALYEEAIERGFVSRPGIGGLHRSSAMGLAATEGIKKLRPLIERFYADLSQQEKRSYPQEELLATLTLRAGGKDRDDAVRLAAERVAALRPEELALQMNGTEAFRKAVIEVAEEACRPHPFSGERSPGCKALRDAYWHQDGTRRPMRRSQSRAPHRLK